MGENNMKDLEKVKNGREMNVFMHDRPFPYYDLGQVVSRINFEEIHTTVLKKLSAVLGYELERVEVIEGTRDELKDNKGMYISAERSKDGIERILLSPRYIKPGSKSEDTAASYYNEFIYDHGHSNLPEVSSDPFLRIYNLIEDILSHEYSHKVYGDRFKQEILSSPEAREREFSYEGYSATFNEGFARWLSSVSLGHEHPGEIDDLERFSAEHIVEQGGVSAYRDRGGIVNVYKLLKKLSDENGHRQVLDNLQQIALDHFQALSKKYELNYFL